MYLQKGCGLFDCNLFVLNGVFMVSFAQMPNIYLCTINRAALHVYFLLENKSAIIGGEKIQANKKSCVYQKTRFVLAKKTSSPPFSQNVFWRILIVNKKLPPRNYPLAGLVEPWIPLAPALPQ